MVANILIINSSIIERLRKKKEHSDLTSVVVFRVALNANGNSRSIVLMISIKNLTSLNMTF